MKCKNCGEELVENSAFCTKCGSKIADQLTEEKEVKVKEEVTEKVEPKVEEVKEEQVEETKPEIKEEPKVEAKAEVNKEPKKKKSKKGKVLLILLILVALVAGGAYLLRDELEVYFENVKDTDEIKDKMNEIADSASNSMENENTTVEENDNTVEVGPKTLVTTDKRDFYNGLAWSKVDNQFVCVNTEGKVVFRLPEEYTSVTDFTNPDYVLAFTRNENKAIIDNTGKIITTDIENQAFDRIVSKDVIAGYAIVEKYVDTYEKAETQYGIIDFKGGWKLPLSADNAFLQDFTTSIDQGVLQGYNELYFVEAAEKVSVIDSSQSRFRFKDENGNYYFSTSFNKFIKVDGTKLEATEISDEAEILGDYVNGLIPMKTAKYNKKQRKDIITYGFYDVNGKLQVKASGEVYKITEMSESGHYGIITKNNAGTPYVTIMDKEGNKVVEPIKGAIECRYLGENRFYIEYANESVEDKYICNELGERICSVNSSIEDFSDGYAIKDGELYIDKDGMAITIVEE